MTEAIDYGQEYARSLDHYTKPASYAPFDLIGGMRMGFCIEPRPEEGADPEHPMLVKVQSPAGGVGEVDDATLVARANGLRLSQADIARDEAQIRLTRILGTHGLRDSCLYQNNKSAVLAEIAHPSPLMLDRLARTVEPYQHLGYLSEPLRRVRGAAAMLLDEMTDDHLSLLPNVIDQAYEGVNNVPAVTGENRAQFYVANHHPYLGLDRNKVYYEARLSIPAYHDSLAASIADLTSFVPANDMGLRVVARLARTAATQTVLARAHESRLTVVEMAPTTEGLAAMRVEKIAA